MEIKVLKNVMHKNEAIGKDNRELFHQNNIFVFNMMSSPGAGKTTLLENTLGAITKEFKTAVIEGDLYTSRDAERLVQFNIPLIQINTEGGCHLDAKMINESLKEMDLKELDLIMVENVGNLVCPTAFDLGETMRILLYSITEGADKPKKYANMFQSAHIILINKVELAELCNIDLDAVQSEIRELNPTCKIFRVSATKPETLIEYTEFIKKTVRDAKES